MYGNFLDDSPCFEYVYKSVCHSCSIYLGLYCLFLLSLSHPFTALTAYPFPGHPMMINSRFYARLNVFPFAVH